MRNDAPPEASKYLKSKLIKNGFDVPKGDSAIVPVMVYDEEILFRLHQDLKKEGVYTNIVTYPAVRRKECRLRLCVMKDIEYSHLDKAVEIITRLGKKYNVIP